MNQQEEDFSVCLSNKAMINRKNETVMTLVITVWQGCHYEMLQTWQLSQQKFIFSTLEAKVLDQGANGLVFPDSSLICRDDNCVLAVCHRAFPLHLCRSGISPSSFYKDTGLRSTHLASCNFLKTFLKTISPNVITFSGALQIRHSTCKFGKIELSP